MNKHLIAALLAALLATPAFAQDDPPARVGRLSDVEGAASFRTADQPQWSLATLNYPVVAGQSFWTEPQARLEIEVGDAAFRLDESSLVDITRLDDQATQLQLDQGVLNLRIASLPPGGVQVTTPLGAVTLSRPGRYDIDAGRPTGDQPAGQVVVTSFEGTAEFDAPGTRIAVSAGQSVEIGGNPPTAQLAQAARSSFDDWALAREHREVARQSQRYVSPEATGYQDLDDYGSWSSDPDYGEVWYPSQVASDWQPYRDGHWAWVPPWGWTWVDDAPWGFTPFHYGRWAEVHGRWGWCPGERRERPVYAPALVAFIGAADFGVTIAAGPAQPAVGWVPLAPGEVFHPYYRASRDYARNVNRTSVNRTVINNITNVTVVKNVTVNQFRNEQAAVVVPAAAFTHAAPVQRAAVAVPHAQLAQTHVAANLGHLAPTPAARSGAALPAAATAVVPRANAPASLAKAPVTAAALPAVNVPAPPAAPGPKFRQSERKPVTSQPAPAHPGPGPSTPTAPARPAVTALAPPPTTGAAPASPPPSHPTTTAPTPPPATVTPSKPPPHAAVTAVPPPPAPVAPAKPAPPRAAVTAVTPPPTATVVPAKPTPHPTSPPHAAVTTATPPPTLAPAKPTPRPTSPPPHAAVTTVTPPPSATLAPAKPTPRPTSPPPHAAVTAVTPPPHVVTPPAAIAAPKPPPPAPPPRPITTLTRPPPVVMATPPKPPPVVFTAPSRPAPVVAPKPPPPPAAVHAAPSNPPARGGTPPKKDPHKT